MLFLLEKTIYFLIKKIPFTNIINQRILVTGDLELKLQENKIEILKDHLEEADFQKIKDRIIKITQ